MEIIMAKKVKNSDKINDTTLHELLLMMDARLKHIEDIEADNRDIIIKLVKQSNQIVEFLRQLDVEIKDEINIEDSLPKLGDTSNNEMSMKFTSVKELIDEFMTKHKDLQELEKELKKHKEDITPGQIGEA